MRGAKKFALVAFVALLWTPAALADTRAFEVGGLVYVIDIASEHVGDYDRDDWRHWDSGVGGGCFSVRDKVLAEESYMPVATVPGSGGRCRVVEGLWHDPYTGRTFTKSSEVDIDHVVPLHEAHKSGGHVWDAHIRQLYANDLNFKDHLITVESSENRTVKGDRDPKDYLPRPEYRCAYVEAWLHIKHRWRLKMDPGEADAVTGVLEECE